LSFYLPDLSNFSGDPCSKKAGYQHIHFLKDERPYFTPHYSKVASIFGRIASKYQTDK